ncbi:MAG: hypothetical protein ACD_4C00282G0001 [uncultured bacterium (gcode 4)]|uniref:Uncharacterized protein n=1 Tax=uncultured bacterium (gcode 4) TaxID=1234023 RepID=K2F5V4_9BACT|nr:MAG: hypothetical protein ACD_4C00282G0001 [uncultured bacterium (gcode 4)]
MEWLDFYVRFSQLKKNVYDGIIELSEEDGFSIIKRKIESIPLSLEIKKTYLSFHICECSTVSYEEAPNTDFRGEYSIEKMFEDVLFEINKKLGLTTSDVLKYYWIEYVEKSVKDSTESIISKTQSNESKK